MIRQRQNLRTEAPSQAVARQPSANVLPSVPLSLHPDSNAVNKKAAPRWKTQTLPTEMTRLVSKGELTCHRKTQRTSFFIFISCNSAGNVERSEINRFVPPLTILKMLSGYCYCVWRSEEITNNETPLYLLS